jgi:small subunit ribosomal protein S8e
MLWHRRSKRKLTGGLLRDNSKKVRAELGRDFMHVKIADRKAAKIRVRGGNEKTALHSELYANVAVGKDIRKAKILNVLKNPANPNLVRQNIITKGCTIQTEIGKAIVKSRPGQDGLVNAVLIEEK